MDNGHEIMGLKDIATGFNNFFTNIGPNLAKKLNRLTEVLAYMTVC